MTLAAFGHRQEVTGEFTKERWPYNKSRSTWGNADIETVELKDNGLEPKGSRYLTVCNE